MWLTPADGALPDRPHEDHLVTAPYQGRAAARSRSTDRGQRLLDEPCGNRLALALDLERWQCFVGERVLGQPIRLRSDDRPARRCSRLQPSRNVDAVAGCQSALCGSVDLHHSFARADPDPDVEIESRVSPVQLTDRPPEC